ncbi:hypothetical protein VEE61_43520 [Escherichia coli]|nr:hypothetical protein VEE61_43520 [Escherichia coli]
MPVSRNLCIFLNVGLGETINKASGAMQKSANGSDISDVSAFRNALQLVDWPPESPDNQYHLNK